MLANANGAGECVARGMLIGALLGAAHGASRIPDGLKHGLVARAAISREIKRFVVAIRTDPSSKVATAKCDTSDQQTDGGAGMKRDPRKRSSLLMLPGLQSEAKPQVKLAAKCVLHVLPVELDCAPPQPPPANIVSLMFVTHGQ